MRGHKICFYGEIWKLLPNYPGLPFLSEALNSKQSELLLRSDFPICSLLQQNPVIWFKLSLYLAIQLSKMTTNN